jgi:GDP/UDP-N,N'-diacetylbacillosamine 2-epimerase (hydrolysing)
MKKSIHLGVLTSSRADFGIYLPLLKRLKGHAEVQLEIIAFGTHLSERFGYTIKDIEAEGFASIHRVETAFGEDTPVGIAKTYGACVQAFAEFWEDQAFDWVLCLGDRYEMHAAVQAGIPFNIPFAHLHGGETTLGAIDNVFRHQISLASRLHFCALPVFAEKLNQLCGTPKAIHTVGALGLANMVDFKPTPFATWQSQFELEALEPGFILATIHPETIAYEANLSHARALKKTIEELLSNSQVVVTMPNADTLGSVYRDLFERLSQRFPDRIRTVENFGTQGYLSAIHHSGLVMGNSSSGIIEVASLKRYCLNIGQRQAGRPTSPNTLHVPFDAEQIVSMAQDLLQRGPYTGENIYCRPDTVEKILEILVTAQIA